MFLNFFVFWRVDCFFFNGVEHDILCLGKSPFWGQLKGKHDFKEAKFFAIFDRWILYNKKKQVYHFSFPLRLGNGDVWNEQVTLSKMSVGGRIANSFYHQEMEWRN